MKLKPGQIKPLLFLILLAGFCIRVYWGLRQGSDLSALPDQKEYLDLGNHLRLHQGLWFTDARFGDVVYAYRTPGYPVLVAVCQGSLRAVRIAQAFIDVFTIFGIYLLGRRWLAAPACLLAAALLAVNPYMIYFTGTILTETLYTAMIVWGLVLLVISDGPWPAGQEKLMAWLGGAMLLALSIMVRPGGFLLPVVLGMGATLLNYRHGVTYRNRWPLPVASTMLLLIIIVLLPWTVRNRNLLGNWIWSSSNEGITRYDGFNPDASGASDQEGFLQRMPWLASMSEAGRSEYLARLADEYITAHPLDAVKLAAIKIARTWSPVPLSKEFGGKWYYVVIGLSYGTLFYTLVLVGLFRRGLDGAVKRYLLLPALYITASVALSVGSLRYRIPAEPPMALIAVSVIAKKKYSVVSIQYSEEMRFVPLTTEY